MRSVKRAAARSIHAVRGCATIQTDKLCPPSSFPSFPSRKGSSNVSAVPKTGKVPRSSPYHAHLSVEEQSPISIEDVHGIHESDVYVDRQKERRWYQRGAG